MQSQSLSELVRSEIGEAYRLERFVTLFHYPVIRGWRYAGLFRYPGSELCSLLFQVSCIQDCDLAFIITLLHQSLELWGFASASWAEASCFTASLTLPAWTRWARSGNGNRRAHDATLPKLVFLAGSEKSKYVLHSLPQNRNACLKWSSLLFVSC